MKTRQLLLSQFPAFQAVLLIACGLSSATSAFGQYLYNPAGGSNWHSTDRWTIGGVPTGADFPNAVGAIAEFDLPLNASAKFFVGFNGTPPITIGHLKINSSAGHPFDTQFGTDNFPGSLTFQTSPESGPATYTETTGDSNGAVFIRSNITLMSDLDFIQEHKDSNNANAGTTVSGMLNAASGIIFTKAGNMNVNFTMDATPGVGEGFFGSYVIEQGAMRFISNSLLMNAEGFTVEAGGQLQIGANVGEIELADGASLTLTGTGVEGGPTNNDGALRFQLNNGVTTDFNSPLILQVNPVTGSPTVNVSVQLGSGAISARLNKAISGPGGLTKTGGDDLYFAGSESNTHEGGTGAADGRLILNKSDGAIAVPGNLNIGGTSTVVVQQNHQIADNSVVRFTSATQEGTLQLDGPNRQETVGGLLSTDVLTKSGIIESHSDDANSISTLTVAAASTSRFGGVIRDAEDTIAQPGKLAFAKSGVESLELTNANSYSGGTSLNEGTLLINNTTGSGLGTGAVSITGGTLGGRGFIGTEFAPVAVGMTGGALDPGDAAAGALTIFGDVTLGSGAAMNFNIGGATAGTEYDQLVTFGSLDLGGASLQLSLGEFVPGGIESFTLINNADANPIVGTFGNYGEGDLLSLNGAAYAITYAGGDGGNDVVLNPSSAVLDADFNGDSIVDGTDFLVWQRGVGTSTGASHGQGDANGDQAINGSDLNVWRDQFGTNPVQVATAAVPEPSSAALTVACLSGLAAMARRGRRRR